VKGKGGAGRRREGAQARRSSLRGGAGDWRGVASRTLVQAGSPPDGGTRVWSTAACRRMPGS